MRPTLNVHIRVTDEATGRPTPVRIRFAGPDGEYYPPLGRSAEFPVGRNEDVGGHVYQNGKRYAYIDGGCEVSLPTGVPLSVEISKGPAYTAIRETIVLGEGQLTLRLTIHRWVEDRWAGLTTADSRCHFLSPHAARLEAAAEGLDVVNLLARVQDYPSQDGHMYRVTPNLSAFSGQAPALESVFVNTFNVHPALGRLGLLHSHRAVYPLTSGMIDETDDWSLSDWCDQCHRKKGLVVWCDAYRPEAGLPGGEALVNAILGKVDAIEVDALERTTPFLPAWYRLLNAGIRLPLVGGSGKESNRIALGGMRTFTPAAGSFREWVDHVRAGRTVVGNGPYLRFTVDGEKFVTQINQDAPGPLRLRAEAASAVAFERMEILANGYVIATAKPTGDPIVTCEIKASHVLPEGGWIAARCVGTTKPDLYPHASVIAHTSPVWVDVAGRPIPGRAEVVAALLQEIEGVRLWADRDGRFTHPRRRDHLLSLCAAAAGKLTGQP